MKLIPDKKYYAKIIKRSTLCRRLILVFILVTYSFTGYSQTYYVSQRTGNDNNPGTLNLPVKTTSKVNTLLANGVTVLFKRGDSWNYEDGDYLRLISSVTYGAYGEGPRPVLSRSINTGKNPDYWRQRTENQKIWILSKKVDNEKVDYTVEGTHFNTALVCYNHDSVFGAKKFSMIELTAQGDFYTEERNVSGTTQNVTYVYSDVTPDKYYNDIAVVTGQSGMAATNETEAYAVSNIVIRDLSFYRCGWNGIGIPMASDHILIENCHFSFCGGQRQVNNEKPDVRRGQCINTQGNINNLEIRNCIVSEGWDGGIALQGWKENLMIKDVWIHHNIIYRNEYGLEIWSANTSTNIQNVHFENNTCFYNGYGWANAQRETHKKKGSSIFTWSFNGEASDIFIRNNISYMDKAPSFFVWNAQNNKWKTAFKCDYNLFFDGSPQAATEGEKAIWFTDYTPTGTGNYFDPGENLLYLYTASEFAGWKAASGFDEHTKVELDPLFYNIFSPDTNLVNYDPRLKSGSPAIGAGLSLTDYSSHVDIWGNPQGTSHNIGAYSGQGISSGIDNTESGRRNNGEGKILIYPNPATSYPITVTNLPPDSIELIVTDLTGSKVYERKLSAEAEVIIPSNSFSSGIYIISVRSSYEMSYGKLLKQ